MMRALITTLCLGMALPAMAYIDQVQLPESAETGELVVALVEGSLPDTCWEFLGFDVELAGTEATIHLWTAFTAPPGVGCPAVLMPYDCFPELVFDRPGTWTVQVREHRSHPELVLPDLVHEQTIEVTGTVPSERRPWGGVKAAYR